MVLRRLVLLTVALHLLLERSQLLSFDFIEHLVRHESFVRALRLPSTRFRSDCDCMHSNFYGFVGFSKIRIYIFIH